MSRPGSPRDQALARLRELAAGGVDGLPPSALGPRPGRQRARSARRPPPAPTATAPPAASALPLAGPGDDAWNALDLAGLADFLRDCSRCKLAEGRTQVVFGVGDPAARLMFVGEGPGRDEDLQGEPFVGRAGRLLTDMIEKGLRLRRGDVYIANVVKCRPPRNRDPEPDEVAACEGFLERQVELVDPEVVVALGRFAIQALLRTKAPVSRLRGSWHEYRGRALMPTFHPAYLLRNPADKRLAWEDLKAVMARLGLG